MSFTRIAIFTVLLLAAAVLAYDRIDDYDHIMHYYEEHSQFLIVHAYFNRHFSSAPQFEDFTNTIEETQYRNKDYVKFLLTDCEKIESGVSQVCDDLRKTKDNHAIVCYFPSGEFINYAGKKMQNPPKSRKYRHPSDTYTVQELEQFLSEITPNFYQDINSMEQFQQWLEPRYSPNLIFVTREDDVPITVAHLGIHFFLRFDLGYLNDLTEQVVKHLNITSFPQLIVLKYNFEQATHELYRYPGREFSSEHYEEIKAFLQPLALKTPRNDLLFHKIKASTTNQDLVTTDKVFELAELLDRANGWAFVSETNKSPQQLHRLKEKYGPFFEYYHYLNSSQEAEVISLYDPERKKPIQLPRSDIQWRALSKDEFISNTSLFLTKNFVVMGVREQYSHFCTLALSNFFRGLTHCFILKEDDYQAASKQMNMQFDKGFICYEKVIDGEKKVSGNNFNSDKFQDVYLTAEYQTRLKSKLIIDDFFERPIKSIAGSQKISEICSFPFKKCAILFTDSSKQDRTAYEYLKDVAMNFINEYQFYEVDLSCNQHFKEQIPNLKKTTNGLVVYHPRQDSYLYLKAKLSRSTFERFLKVNLGDHSKLPLKKWTTDGIQAGSCKPSQTTKGKSSDSEDGKVEETLDL